MKFKKIVGEKGQYLGMLESIELNVLLNWARHCDKGSCGRPDCDACKYIRGMINELERIAKEIDDNTDERLFMLEKFALLNKNFHQ